jgi:hypothetical protein
MAFSYNFIDTMKDKKKKKYKVCLILLDDVAFFLLVSLVIAIKNNHKPNEYFIHTVKDNKYYYVLLLWQKMGRFRASATCYSDMVNNFKKKKYIYLCVCSKYFKIECCFLGH